jgi:hypothetical protein
MGKIKLWNWVKKLWSRFWKRLVKRGAATDRVNVKLLGMEINLTRDLPEAVPYELTIVIPRVEYRLNKKSPDGVGDFLEVLLNSITVVHSPRNPEAGSWRLDKTVDIL